jgi:hypothetical protein
MATSTFCVLRLQQLVVTLYALDASHCWSRPGMILVYCVKMSITTRSRPPLAKKNTFLGLVYASFPHSELQMWMDDHFNTRTLSSVKKCHRRDWGDTFINDELHAWVYLCAYGISRCIASQIHIQHSFRGYLHRLKFREISK